MRLLKFIAARLQEASTYAGLSALCLALASAMNQPGCERSIAIVCAVATAIGAIAKAEKNVELTDVMTDITQLAPVLIKTVEAVEGLSSAGKHPLC